MDEEDTVVQDLKESVKGWKLMLTAIKRKKGRQVRSSEIIKKLKFYLKKELSIREFDKNLSIEIKMLKNKLLDMSAKVTETEKNY